MPDPISTTQPSSMPTVPPITDTSSPKPVIPAPATQPSQITTPSNNTSLSTDNLVLDETHRTQLDGIVNQMVQNNEPDHAIQFVVNDFKSKYGSSGSPTNQPSSSGPSYNPLTPEGETNLGNALGKVFPGGDLGAALGKSSYSIGQFLSGAYHTIVGAHDRAQENFNNAFSGAPTDTDISKATADAIQAGLAIAPAGSEGTLLQKTAQGAATGYGFDVTQNVKNNGNLTNPENYKPGAGTAIGGTLPFATALVGAIAKHVTGFTSGTGSEVIQRAIDNPDAVDQAVKTYAATPEAKQNLVDRARAAISDFLAGNQDEYASSIKNLETKAPLQLNVASQSLVDGVSKFGGNLNDEGDLIFKNSSLTTQDQKDLQSAYKTISNWTDDSVTGMDNLRQAVSNLMDDFKLQGNARANLILGNVKQNLVDHIAESTPGYQGMLDQYGNKAQTASALIKELNLGGNARASTQLNSIMRLFQRDPSIMEKVSTVMGPDKAEAFMNELSGAILSDWIPAGRMGNYIRGAGELATLSGGTTASAVGGASMVPALATGVASAAVPLATMSPKVVGTTARLSGRAAQAGFGPTIRKVGTYIASKLTK